MMAWMHPHDGAGSVSFARKLEPGTTLPHASPLLDPGLAGGGDGSLELRQVFSAVVARLHAAGVPTPELDARLLLCAACGLTHEEFVADPVRALDRYALQELERLVVQRERRRPVSRILGRREFWGREFALADAALDPRPDSETLVAAALEFVRGKGQGEAPVTVLDLGTGTGCLLVSLLAELPHAEGIGVDASAAALAIARANAARLGLADRARFVCGSWLDSVAARFDVILANPPYIPSADIASLAPEVACYEPRLALDGGPDGLDAYRAIALRLFGAVALGGAAFLEVGQEQARPVAALLAAAGWPTEEPALRMRCDLAGRPRCLELRAA